MNKHRRNELCRAMELLNEVQEILETCSDEEQEYADNMPENLQGGEKHEKAEETANEISDVAEECRVLSETIYYIESE